jgi:DNA segregation ATPase FtsK/SpoIIIE-like protein
VLNGGQTDRGKSSWTRHVLTWLALCYPPEHVRLALIDLKAGSS